MRRSAGLLVYRSAGAGAAPEVLGAVMSRGIGCEVMDTGAACRTYNILASEGRTVVVALLFKHS